jgi:serine/threonine-protein kinase
MGMVYLGRDPKINRDVAIKTLRYDEIEPDLLAEVMTCFYHEAEAAGKLFHANIVTTFDAGEDYDVAYLAMELLDGNDLADVCKKEHLLPVEEVLRIVSRVADALDFAHRCGVVHRDIKPANIIRLANGDIKVKDFGIARVAAKLKTQTGVVMGTPSYMSPEQITGSKVDGRSDIFSLGVVFFELLTGEKPFQGESMATLMYTISKTPHRRVSDFRTDVSEYFDMIIDKMLAKEPEHRYQLSIDIANDIAMAMLNA